MHIPGLTKKILLVCGILSSLLYIIMNIVTAMMYDGYDVNSQTVSELSAIGAPTRSLWVPMGLLYGLLIIAFGYGISLSAENNRRLKIVGIIFIIDGFIGFFWPPMHTREVLAAGGGTITDTLHIVWTCIHIPLVMLCIGFGAFAFGKKFLVYSIVTFLILMVAGIFTGIDGPKISRDLPTPWIGVWERITIAAYLVWMVVLSIILLKKQRESRVDNSLAD